MILFVYYLRRQLQQQQLLLITLLLQLSPLQRNFDVSAQWITVSGEFTCMPIEFSMRVPGRCTNTNDNSKNSQRQQFDCGSNKMQPQQQRCIPLQHFHDGIVDCPDGSDEFCFPGYVKCGSYCVSLQYAAQCFINPRCDNSPTSPQFCDVTKKKLCSIEGTVPCKGYGECVMRKWIEKGQTNCIDKSDQDHVYIAVFGIRRRTNLYPNLQFGGNTSDVFRGMTSTQRLNSSWLQSVSLSPSNPGWRNDTDRDFTLEITKEWNNTTIQSTTKQFVFQIPNSNMIDLDLKSSNFNTTTIYSFTSKAENFNDSIHVNHQVQQNSQNMIPTNRQEHFSNTYQNFTMPVEANQVGHDSSDNSNGITTTTYQLHLTTVKSSITDFFTANSAVEMLQSSLTYRRGENPTQQIFEKLESSIKASINPAEMAKSSDAIPADNNSNGTEYNDILKQNTLIAPNGISLSSSNQQQNQNEIFNLSPNKISNSTKNTAVISKELQSPSLTPNQHLEESNISTTPSPSPNQIACARYEYAEAQRLVPKPTCTCPPGQMPSGENATCKTTIVSTFGIDVNHICGGMETDPEERSRLAILVLNRTRLPYQACVRRDGYPVMVQLNCSQCTTTEFDEAFKRNSNDQYIPLRIMGKFLIADYTELSLGACLTSALNDCDPEHADCLVNGPRYECRCHEGWNDTSEEIGQAEGRRCEQLISLANGCILFLGYCLFWWFLLFGIILFLVLLLLCFLYYIIYEWCKKRRQRNVVVEEQGHLVTSKIGSVTNSFSKVATTESINMTNNPNSIGLNNISDDEKAVSTVDTKCIANSNPSNNQNVSKATKKVLVSQESVESLDEWQTNDEINKDEKQSPKKQLEVSKQTSGGLKSERKETLANKIINADSLVSSHKRLKRTTSESYTTSNEVSLESQKSTNMMTHVISQKGTEVLPSGGNVIKKLEKAESTNSNVMNVSQSLSETSLRTMWELFKQGMWKQSSRPSSIKSSTPSLDRLIDVFLCRKRSKKIHPDAITTSNSIEYPLDTVKTVDHGIDITSQLSDTIFTTVTTCCGTIAATATTTTTTANSNIPKLLHPEHAVSSSNDVVNTNVPMQTHVLEQKIITDTKTSTGTSTMSLLPGELPLPLNVAAAQSPNSSIAVAIFDRSKHIQANQPTSGVALTAANEILQQNNSTNVTTAVEMQHSAVEKNAAFDQKPSTIAQIENEAKDPMNSKLSTTTIATSSDIQLERWISTAEPCSSVLCKRQFEHGRRLNNDAEQKTPSTADELRDALKEIASTKPPTKRLTENQKKKLSVSCGHLHIQGDNEIGGKGGGFICQSLATARQQSRRKLSSIAEKSIEMMNGGSQLIPSPSSISCPTTTRRNKGFIPTFERNFNPMNDGNSKLEHNRTNTKVRLRKDSDTSSWHQRPIYNVDSRPSWDFSPLKDGDLDRIAPLKPGFLHCYQRRKWLSPLPLDDERVTALRLNRGNMSGRRQSDWRLHDVPHAPIAPTSHSARLNTHLSSAKMLRNSSGIKWTPYSSEDHSKPAKEQLWWGAH